MHFNPSRLSSWNFKTLKIKLGYFACCYNGTTYGYPFPWYPLKVMVICINFV